MPVTPSGRSSVRQRDLDAAGLVERLLGRGQDLLRAGLVLVAAAPCRRRCTPTRPARASRAPREPPGAAGGRRAGERHGVSLAHAVTAVATRTGPAARPPGPATAAIGWLPGVPEPSRLPTGSGRSIGAPLAAAARAGASPAQAVTSSVLALEEAVAPHAAGGPALGGVLAERRHLDRARLGAGQRGRGAGRGDHDGVVRRRTVRRTRRPARRRRRGCRRCHRRSGPAAGPSSAPKCSSWASVVMKQSVSLPVASSTAPTTSSPSSSRITSHSSLPRTSGLTRLTVPWRVPSARPGPSVAEAAQRERPLAGLQRGQLADRVAALEVRVVGRGRQRRAGRARTSLSSRPARGEQADLAAGGGRHRRDHDVVVGAAAARRRPARR